MRIELNLKTEVVAGKDLFVNLSVQIYGLGDKNEEIMECVKHDLPKKISELIQEAEMEARGCGCKTIKDVRKEGGGEIDLVFLNGTAYFPVTNYYEIMNNLTDWSAWEHLRRFGQEEHYWNFERQIFIASNAE